jgi:geranylgeranyl diphosphate synthase type I
MNVRTYLDRYLPLLENELKEALASPHDALSPYYGMMQYHMGWLDEQLGPAQASQGKRLRPVLCLLTCEAVGGPIECALPVATAIELLHNFSLIHDDIQDDSATRRHRTTVWKLWGLPHGINSGDGMFALSFLTLGRLQERGVPAQIVLSAQRIFAETCLALTEGQYLDMTFETQTKVDIDDYLWMVRNKTAALIACSTHLGALLGGADAETVAAYAHFGENLGMAFQVIDDILGIWGQEQRTGKSTSSDILTRKKTLPVVYALSDSELQALYAKDVLADSDVAHAIAILEQNNARAFAEQMAYEYAQQAISYLERAGQDTLARQAIADLAQSLLQRTS